MTDRLNHYGAIVVSVFALVLFGGAMIVSFMTKNETMMSMTVGAAVSMAPTVVGFWIGSSSGSQKKDAVIASKVPTPPPAS